MRNDNRANKDDLWLQTHEQNHSLRSHRRQQQDAIETDPDEGS